MSKKKQGSISLNVHKYTNLKYLQSSAESYWNTTSIQPFFPPIEKLFKTSLLENFSEYGLKFPSEITNIVSENTISILGGKNINVHKKISMILNPFKLMEGSYGTNLSLPSSIEQSTSAHNKIQNYNNAAYIGSLISASLAASGSHHFPEIYGIFTGLRKSHTIDISDDYEDLCDRSWFSNNMGNTFTLKLNENIESASEFKHTRSMRPSIQLGESITMDFSEVEGIQSNSEIANMSPLFNDTIKDDSESDCSSVSTSYIFEIRSCNSSIVSEEDDESFEYDDDEPFAWASFSNVPVQITLMEKCKGTFFELITLNTESYKHEAWFAQIILALAFAQSKFSFVHNDLHANNVMYIETIEEYLYYNCSGTFFKIPTYGYLIKIIDFERSSFSLKLLGLKESKFFISDQFCIDEEAGGQYNCEPFYNSKFPLIKPNFSFDLVRLTTSIFWDLFPEGPLKENNSFLFKLFMKWLTLDDGSSILFGKKEPQHDRFHGFHLYKAIARLCNNAIPRKEIMEFKELFSIAEIPADKKVCLIE